MSSRRNPTSSHSALAALTALAVALSFLLPITAVSAQESAPGDDRPGAAADSTAQKITTRLIVHATDDAEPADLDEVLEALPEAAVIRGVETISDDTVAAEVIVPTTAEAVSEGVNARSDADVDVGTGGDVEVTIEPDLVLQPAVDATDPHYASMWGLNSEWGIQAPAAWNISTGRPDVVVGVVDTGIDYRHADLDGRIWSNTDEIAGNGIDDDRNGYVDDTRGWDFYHNNASVYDAADSETHGTHVAGTIGAEANNGVGVTGVAWDVRIMPLKFLSPNGGHTSDAIRAIRYAVANGADLINASWGGYGYSAALADAIADAGKAGVLVVAAAGNAASDSATTPFYPAAFDLATIVSVAAITSRGRLAPYSNYGSGGVDIGAPGSGILSTVPNNRYRTYDGTSMATAYVTGVAALLHADGVTNPKTVKARLLDGARIAPDLKTRTVSSGTVDASTALDPTVSASTWSASTLSGATKGGPGVASWESGRLDVFTRRGDDALWRRAYDGSWGGWQSLGGTLTSDPAAVSWGPNRIDAFARGTDKALYHRWWDGAKWRGWESLGGRLTGGPAVASWSGRRLDVFVRGAGNALYHKWFSGKRWSNWENLGGQLASDPTAVSWGPNRIDVFARGGDTGLWHRWWDGSSWHGWERLGSGLEGGPGVASRRTSRLEVFVRRSGGQIYQRIFDGDWSAWIPVHGKVTSDPAAVSWGGSRTDVFARTGANQLVQASTGG